ncbi:transposase [Bradyrhizobium sp. BR 1432]|uniref:transposase n=1 Tax=Bradyrhizobium sp. BR 1432 TaxID=3447966 RepID=UPI003EE80604
MKIGPSQAETPGRRSCARSPAALLGVKLVVSDAHEGIKAAVSKGAQRHLAALPRVHFMPNALAHTGKSGRCVSCLHHQGLCPGHVEAARAHWRKVAHQLYPRLPKLAGFFDEAETEALSYTPI